MSLNAGCVIFLNISAGFEHLAFLDWGTGVGELVMLSSLA